jgi:adenosine/AMP kinase
MFPSMANDAMANPTLFFSSFVFGAISIYFVLHFSSSIFFRNLVILGVATSLVNHGLTSDLAKRVDRSVMVTGACHDFFVHSKQIFPINIALAALLSSSILLFFSAKYTIAVTHNGASGNVRHFLAHFVLAVCHCWMATLI